MFAHRLARRALVLGVVVALVAVTGCSLDVNTLGGREKCWPESDARAASLWRGVLRTDGSGGQLDTPEGDVIPLLPGALTFGIDSDGFGALVRGGDVVASDGADVTLFGGAGSDGALVVCAVEEVHATP